MTRIYKFPRSSNEDEPARDARLGQLLRSVVGEPPLGEMDWPALAARIGDAIRSPHAAPWWSHVERWKRRALPLALAAGLVGAVALWNAATGSRPDASWGSAPVDLVSAVVSGDFSADAADSYAGAVTGSIEQVAEFPE